MKRLNYLILFVLISIVSPPLWAGSQLEWKAQSVGTATSVNSYDSLSLAANEKNVPNVSISSNPANAPKAVTESEAKDIYGFSMTNPNDRTLLGLVKFSSASTTEVTHIGQSAEYVRAGAWANDNYYMTSITGSYPKGLYTADLNTGELTLVADYLQNGEVRAAIDMSYDYSTETMFMVCNGDGNSNTALRTIDLATGAQTLINNNMGHYFRAIAVNMDGVMYGIENSGLLCTINKTTGEAIVVGSTGRTPFFFQSMEFDHETGVLYWACCEARHNSELCIVDTATATVTSLGIVGQGTRGEQVVALYIPFKMSEPGAPAKVDDLTAVADANGANSAVISWTNPTNTYSSEALSSITKVEVLRDGTLVKTITDAVPGQASSYTDVVDNAATYLYKVIPYNEVGTGVGKSVSTFIGHDLPAAVSNAEAIRTGNNSIALSWDAATVGINNGFLDTSSIRYKVTRNNDSAVIANDLTETSFTDNAITTLARYTYDIEVYNADGTGGVTTTNYVVTGPNLSVPYIAYFANDEDASLWTAVDNNRDGNTFAVGYNYSSKANEYVYTANTNQADDWVVSPMITLEAGKYYKIVADVKCGNAYRPETCSIYLIKNRNLNNAVKLSDDFIINDPTGTIKCRADIDNADGGDYAIAVRCTSAAAADHFAVSAVALEVNHDGAIRGDVWDNNDNEVEGVVVSLADTDFSAVTDSKGQFEIVNIPQGEYQLICTKLGYKGSVNLVTVTELKTTNVELDVILRGKYTVSGTVKNEYGEALPNASVELSGYNSYKATTDASGAFAIDGVYEAEEEEYTMAVLKPFYNAKLQYIKVTDSNVSVDMALNDEILAPVVVNAVSDNNETVATIDWSVPGFDVTSDTHGTAISSTFGANDGTANTLIGMICPTPIALSKLNWIDYYFNSSINIVILALDKNGKVTSEVLFKDEDATNTMADLSEYTFESPVIAPYGCFIGLSCDSGSLGIGTVAATQNYPFLPNTWGVIDDYTVSTDITFLESLGSDYMENLFLDIAGYLLASDESPKVTYNVYRTDEANNETLVSPSPMTALTFADYSWASLASGNYTYSVEAVYRNNSVSDRSLSNSLNKQTSGVASAILDKCVASVEGDVLSFSQPIVAATLYSINGMAVASVDNASSMAISSLAKGVYIVHMNVGNQILTQKVIIK